MLGNEYKLRVYYKMQNVSFLLSVVQENKAMSPAWGWEQKFRLRSGLIGTGSQPPAGGCSLGRLPPALYPQAACSLGGKKRVVKYIYTPTNKALLSPPSQDPKPWSGYPNHLSPHLPHLLVTPSHLATHVCFLYYKA